MVFGLSNSAQTFQRFMNTVFQGLPNIFVDIDNILVASKNLEDHYTRLRELFCRLRQYGLTVNSEKCEFGRSNLIFLGHDVSADGIKPSPDKVAAVASFDILICPHVAEIMNPLYAAISKQEKNLHWTEEMTAAFEKSKDALSHATQLVKTLLHSGRLKRRCRWGA